MSYQKISIQAGVPYTVDMAGLLFLLDTPGVADGIDVALVKNGTPGPVMPNRRTAFRHVAPFDAIQLTAAVDTVVGCFISFDDVQLGIADGSAVTVPGGLVIVNDDQQPIPVNFAGTVAPVLGELKVTNTDALAIPVVQKSGTTFSTAGKVTNTNAEAVPVVQKTGTSFAVVLGNTDAQAVPVVQKTGTVFTVEQATEVDTRSYLATVVANEAPVPVTAVAAVFLPASATRRGFRVKNVLESPIAIGGAGLTFANAAVLIQPGETWLESEAPGAAWSAICDAGMASTLNIQTVT